ncbi:MAG: anti-sigma factor [Cyclobacteriaceae bacterium]
MRKLFRKPILIIAVLGVILSSCGDDDGTTLTPNGGTISGGPFTFVVDGTSDFVSGITVDDTDVVGTNSTWVITDEDNNILGLPGTLDDLEGVDFDAAGTGVCFIWYLRYEGELEGLAAGMSTGALDGSFDLSNSITVTRNALNAGTITGGPFTFVVDDQVDNVSGIEIDNSSAMGANSSWLITDADGKVLGMPGTLDAVHGVDFDGAGVGVCFIWYVRYGDALTGLAVDADVDDLNSDHFALSNSIMVTRVEGAGVTLDIAGLENLGADFVYEGWVLVDGTPVTTGTFTVNDAKELSKTMFYAAKTDVDAATKFILTIEPAMDTDPAPSAQKLIAGDFSSDMASLSTATAPAVGDFSAAAGTFFLRTPTDEADDMNNGNDEFGIWFGSPGAPPTANFTLPTLGEGWTYEGWVVTENGPLSTGTFTDFGAVDSGNPFSSTVNNVGPPVPGEDFFVAPAGSMDTFPLDMRGLTTVISVEPVPDNSTAPFLLKPLLSMIAADAATAPTSHDFGQNLSSLPTGSATR